MLGVRIGRRVFDDGCVLTERTFVTIGDRCTLNAGSVIQCHSQEDGAFKSDRSAIGAGCTLGVGAFVHYGVTIENGAVLAAVFRPARPRPSTGDSSARTCAASSPTAATSPLPRAAVAAPR